MRKDKIKTKEYQKQWRKNNKEKIREYARIYYQKNKEEINAGHREKYLKHSSYYQDYRNRPHVRKRNRIWQIQRRYGLTQEAYNALLEKQKFRCAICKTDNNGSIDWHVDHDHITGKVRGLLCNLCNRGLGSFKDNKDFLREAIQYLQNVDNDNSSNINR